MTAPLSPQQALAEQQRIARRVSRDRAQASSAALPLGLFGALSIVAAGVIVTAGLPSVGLFWAIAGPAGGLLLAWWFRKRELRLPFDQPPTVAMIFIAVSLVTGALVLGFSGDGTLAFSAVGSGYVLFAAASGNQTTFNVAIAIITLSWLAQIEAWFSVTGADAAQRTIALSAAVGLAQLAGASAERRRVSRATTSA